MEFTICKIKPRGSFHLGEKEMVLEKTSNYIHSDTLFSAICNAYRLFYGNEELKKVLNLFEGREPPFLISSAFPYIDEILLFPIPKNTDFGDYTKDKKFRKVEFVSRTIFERITGGEDIKEHIIGENLVQGNHVLVTSKERTKLSTDKIWTIKEVPRVVIDRKTSASNIYHFGEIAFADNCGLYFLMDLRMKEYEKKVEAAIRVLGDEGIGGDRTYGKGLFKADFKEVKMDLEPKDHFVTLSLYHPREEEVSILQNGYYELINRGGWIYSIEAKNKRRKTVRMLLEGSVFNAPTGLEVYGGLASVKPKGFRDHEVYRYGYAFAVPMEVGE